MNNNMEAYLDPYADLVIRIGLNVQPGQKVWINGNLDSADFIRRLVRKAYEAGARLVTVDWDDETVKRTRMELSSDEALTDYPYWKMRGIEQLMEDGGAYLQVYAPNPDLMKGIPADRMAIVNRISAEASVTFKSYIHNGHNSWGMASVPTPSWASKVFPDKSPAEAMAALWDCIFRVNRVYENDPVQAWKEHLAVLQQKVDELNAKRYRALQYRGPGTNLRIELPEDHLWVGGSQPCLENGVMFVPNIPTEEVFTMPRRDGVTGTVSSTLPLNYIGNVIDRFSLTFEQGRIVSFTAEEGYETLQKLIETDEGSHFLGEVALVPHHSPISDLGVTFYNTIFDENASCHLAIGNAYPMNLKNGMTMSQEELRSHGANQSLTHVDFMMGGAQLDIDGETEDGRLEPIFRGGNWV